MRIDDDTFYDLFYAASMATTARVLETDPLQIERTFHRLSALEHDLVIALERPLRIAS